MSVEKTVAVLEERTKHLEARQNSLEKEVAKKIDGLEGKIDKLSEALTIALKDFNNRPSWFTSMVITILCSSFVSLLVYVASNSPK